MSQFLESFEVFDLALGKPPLYCLPSSASLADAIQMSKELSLSEVSVWDDNLEECLGVVQNLDLLCFLASEEHLADLNGALSRPISNLPVLHKSSIQHVNLHDRLSKALELVSQGVQYLIVPLPVSMKKINTNIGAGFDSRWPWKELCWISQEAVMRFLMSCIAAFCPVPLFSIEELGIVNRNFISIQQDSPAIDALPKIRKASENLSAVAVVQLESTTPEELNLNDVNQTQGTCTKVKLVGDISSSTLRNCDEISTVAALATLSAADFLSYVHGSKRNSKLMGRLIQFRLARKLSTEEQALPRLTSSSIETSCEESSDSEHDSSSSSNLPSLSSQLHRNRACLTCRPWSSLAAVMAQALSHQSSYIWVTDAEFTVVGIVTYVDIIGVLVRKMDKAVRSPSTQKLFSSTPKLVLTTSKT